MTKTAKAAHKAKMSAIYAEADKIVATGKCPCCSTPLVRNLSLAGWYQCGAYAAQSHRKAEFLNLPKCDFQTFTSEAA
jgi:hypothetical protein